MLPVTVSLVLILVGLLGAFVAQNAINVPSRQLVVTPPADLDSIFASFDFPAAVQRLATAVRMKTVSYEVRSIHCPV